MWHDSRFPVSTARRVVDRDMKTPQKLDNYSGFWGVVDSGLPPL